MICSPLPRDWLTASSRYLTKGGESGLQPPSSPEEGNLGSCHPRRFEVEDFVTRRG